MDKFSSAVPNYGDIKHILENTVNKKYSVDWQNRTRKKFYLTGFQMTPATFYSVRTEKGYQEINRNKGLFDVVKKSGMGLTHNNKNVNVPCLISIHSRLIQHKIIVEIAL